MGDGGFPKLGGTILGVPIIRTIVLWGLYWGSLILGNYQIKSKQNVANDSPHKRVNPRLTKTGLGKTC